MVLVVVVVVLQDKNMVVMVVVVVVALVVVHLWWDTYGGYGGCARRLAIAPLSSYEFCTSRPTAKSRVVRCQIFYTEQTMKLIFYKIKNSQIS